MAERTQARQRFSGGITLPLRWPGVVALDYMLGNPDGIESFHPCHDIRP
ncbi:MAG: hypothetical protein PVJ65_03895 [Chromatiales bacterium]|jgi:hypothetical protein